MKTKMNLLLTAIIVLVLSSVMVAQDTLYTTKDGKAMTIIFDKNQIRIDDRVYNLDDISNIDKEFIKENLKDLDKELEEMEIELELLEEEMEMEIEEDIEKEFSFDFSDSEEVERENDDIDNIKTRWILIDYGFSNFIRGENNPMIDGKDPTDLKIWPSFNIGIDIFQTRFNLIKHYVNLKAGLGIEYNYYHFQNTLTLEDDKNEVSWATHPEGGIIDKYSKNRLYTFNGVLPILLNFETNPKNIKKSFHLNVGVYGALLFDSNVKLKYGNKKLEINDDYNLAKLQYGLTGSIGYGWFNLYAKYGLNEFFKEDQNGGYVLTPVSFGVKVTPF